jgi:hypothetical protein
LESPDGRWNGGGQSGGLHGAHIRSAFSWLIQASLQPFHAARFIRKSAV